MNKLWVFMLISVFAHFVGFLYLPAFEIKFQNPPEDIVEVQLVPPTVKEMPPVKKQTAGRTEPVETEPVEPVPPEVAIPDIDIPQMDTEELEVAVPDIDTGEDIQGSDILIDDALLAEIDDTGRNLEENRESGRRESPEQTESRIDENKFYVIKNISNNRRSLTNVPPEPEFSLTADTKVTISFNIDREGNTYNILLLTRTDSEIEKIAVDFVKRLKFQSVVDGGSDSAEITLFFRVGN